MSTNLSITQPPVKKDKRKIKSFICLLRTADGGQTVDIRNFDPEDAVNDLNMTYTYALFKVKVTKKGLLIGPLRNVDGYRRIFGPTIELGLIDGPI